VLRAFEGLRDCDTYTQAFLHGLTICYSDFTTDLRFKMRKVWRDVADMNLLENDKKLVTYHSWFASGCSLLDLQLEADSRTRARNGGDPPMPPRYLYLELPKHVMRNVSRFCLRAHTMGSTLATESSIWRDGNDHCDKCSCAALQNEVHVHSLPTWQQVLKTCLCSNERCIRSFSSFYASPFLRGPPYRKGCECDSFHAVPSHKCL